MSDSAFEIQGMSTLTAPDVWLACDCGTACVFRRAPSFDQGWLWVWQPDCKHPRRESHEYKLMTKDGYALMTTDGPPP